MTLITAVLNTTRVTVNSTPDALNKFQLYALIEAYEFIRKSLYYPEREPPELTELEVGFLKGAYERLYKERKEDPLYSPSFEKAVAEMEAFE